MWKQLLISLLLLCSLPAMGQHNSRFYLVVLGVAQDGSYPHAGCTKQCCEKAWAYPEQRRYATSLALVDSLAGKWWLLEATPDITAQLHYFNVLTKGRYKYLPNGIYITHAHIGHYTGLMQLGREVMGAKEMPVYVLPKMKAFLENNGPWSQLVALHNIRLFTMASDSDSMLTSRYCMGTKLADGLGIFAFTVPHRDEFSETAGFCINVSNRRYVFIPDVDKWSKWRTDIRKVVSVADVALIDGTFYGDTELPGRNMSEVPHPFVQESMSLLLDYAKKVYFIHLNHTNPLLWDAEKQAEIRSKGFNIAEQGQKL